MDHLRACIGCARHVFASESSCPFCGAELPASEAPVEKPRRRLGRAATFAFGVALAASACSDSHGERDAAVDDAGASEDAGGADAGMGEEDAGVRDDAGMSEDAGIDAGGTAPPYGAPPADGA